jgi:hypothetical protein
MKDRLLKLLDGAGGAMKARLIGGAVNSGRPSRAAGMARLAR